MRIAGKTFLIIAAVIAIGGILFFVFSRLKDGKAEERTLEEESEIIDSSLYESEAFNPSLLTWQEIKTNVSWSVRDSHTAVAYKDKIYLMGGLNGNDYVVRPGKVEYGNAPHFSDIWSSQDGTSWELVTDKALWGKRRSLQAVVFEDKIFVIPGWGPWAGTKNDIWSSEDGIQWELVNSNPNFPPREGHQLIVFKDKLWLIGGVNYEKGEVRNDIWFSEDGKNWSETTSTIPWLPRWDHEIVLFKDKLWLIGGMDLKDNVFSEIWSSEDGENWFLVTDNPPWPARQGHEAVVFKDRIWILGRFNDESQGGGNNDVWFSDDGINWQKTEKDPAWSGREDHAAVVFQDKIWILGGMSSDWQWQNDIWHSVSLP